MAVIAVRDLEVPVRVVSLARPEKRNAFNREIVYGLRDALAEFESSAARALIIRAEGDHFCAGADLSDPPPDFWKCLPGVGVQLTKPVICATQGWTIGLGLTLMMMCDLAVAADDARFSFPEARVGVFGGMAAGLVARIPQKVAIEFLMLGEPMSAARAYEVGMINRVVPRAELDSTAMQMATTVAGMAPKVLAAMKRWTAQTTPRAPAEIFSVEAAVVGAMMASNDLKEGIASFKERRSAQFTGS